MHQRGNGTSPNINGLVKQLDDPTNPTDVAGFDAFVAAFAGAIDGLWASTMRDIAIVANVAAYKLSAKNVPGPRDRLRPAGRRLARRREFRRLRADAHRRLVDEQAEARALLRAPARGETRQQRSKHRHEPAHRRLKQAPYTTKAGPVRPAPDNRKPRPDHHHPRRV